MTHVEMKKEDLEDEEMKEIDNDTKLYSNIGSLSKDNLKLKVACRTRLTKKNGITRYVKLNIKYDFENSRHDIDKIQPIKQLLP